VKRCLLAVAATIVALLPGTARTQERQLPPDPSGLLCIGELWCQFSSLLTEIQNLVPPQGPRHFVCIRLKTVGAAGVAQRLTVRLSNNRKALWTPVVRLGSNLEFAIWTDADTNTLYIWASEKKLKQAKEIVQRLENEVYLHYFIFVTLQHMDAAQTARMLKALLDDNDGGIIVIDDQRTNGIIITGTATKVQLVRELLDWLDPKDK
jgi:type II secretory pathway component GspD/PulD (secretin)